MRELKKHKAINAIYVDIIAIITEWIRANEDLAGWKVMQAFQPRQQSDYEKLITVSNVWVGTVGSQGNKDYAFPDGIIHSEKVRIKRLIQFDFHRERKLTDDITAVNADDVCQRLANYLQSEPGVQDLLMRGYSLVRIASMRSEQNLMDDERFHISAGFDLELVYDDTIESIMPYHIGEVGETIAGI